jgi:protocatechuate 3,4-dioxygenase beta subunit
MTRRLLVVALLFLAAMAGIWMLNHKKAVNPSGAVDETNSTPIASGTNATEDSPTWKRRKSKTDFVTNATSDNTNSPALDILAAGQHLTFLVRNEEQAPLAGAEVKVRIATGTKNSALTNFNRTISSDQRGLVDVLWPKEPINMLTVSASKDGYASRKMEWDFKTGDTVPSDYTIVLRHGVTFSGHVVDPQDQPVSRASVQIFRFWSGGEEMQRKGQQSSFNGEKYVTDDAGLWTAKNLPPELIDHLSITVNHSNFMPTRFTVSDATAEKALRDGSHVVKLQRGLEIFGRISDEQDNPIAGATVWFGKHFRSERQQTKTDVSGHFQFKNVQEGREMVAAMAEGFAPHYEYVDIKAGMPEISFHLGKGSVIAGVVKDSDDQPVEGARVVLEGRPGQAAYDAYEFSQQTDKDGKFAWRSAPDEAMPFYIGKTGYQQLRGVELKPGEDNVVALRKVREVQGLVLDAESGLPVRTFKVTLGRLSRDDFFPDQYSAKEFTTSDGKFSISVSEASQTTIEVSSLDYAEQRQAVPNAENEGLLTFRLKSNPALEGTVVEQTGQPVADAQVVVLGSSITSSIHLTASGFRNYSRTKIFTTDQNGHFKVPSPPADARVAAVKGDSFASATVEEIRSAGQLKMELFGKIEGVVLNGSEPRPGQELYLTGRDSGISFDFNRYKVVSDAEGKFAFDRVPPGTVSVVRLIKTSSHSWQHSHAQEVQVRGGETAQVVIGGSDATVQAQVRWETAPTQTNYALVGNLSTVTSPPPGNLSREQLMNYYKSPDFRAQEKLRKYYAAVVGANGLLVIDTVAPGDYELSVKAVTDEGGPASFQGFAEGSIRVTIPEGSQPGTPIYAGEVIVRPRKSK